MAPLLFLAAPGSAAGADGGPTTSRGSLAFQIDTASFRGDSGRVVQEVYTLIDAVQLEFVPYRGRFKADLAFKMTVVDTNLTPVAEHSWTREVAIREPKELYSHLPFQDLHSVALAPGTYGVSLTVTEVGAEQRGTAARMVEAPSYSGVGLKASELLVANQLSARGDDRFKKGKWDVVPKVSRDYTVGDSVYVYYEVYNLASHGGSQDEPFVVNYSLVDAQGTLVSKSDDEMVPKTGHTAAQVGRIGTDHILPGRYRLIVEIYDAQSRDTVSRERVIDLAPWRGVRASDGSRRPTRIRRIRLDQ